MIDSPPSARAPLARGVGPAALTRPRWQSNTSFCATQKWPFVCCQGRQALLGRAGRSPRRMRRGGEPEMLRTGPQYGGWGGGEAGACEPEPLLCSSDCCWARWLPLTSSSLSSLPLSVSTLLCSLDSPARGLCLLLLFPLALPSAGRGPTRRSWLLLTPAWPVDTSPRESRPVPSQAAGGEASARSTLDPPRCTGVVAIQGPEPQRPKGRDSGPVEFPSHSSLGQKRL